MVHDFSKMPNPKNSSTRPSVAIIGAGITGLLVAHGLKRHGFPVTVFDRDASADARGRDWSILIHWAMPLLERLLPPDLLARLPEALTTPHLDFTEDVETFPCYNGRDGSLIFNNKTPLGRRVSRQRMRALLLDGLEEEEDVRWGKTLASFSSQNGDDESPMCLRFADGSTHSADFVLGADGASSAVRRELFNGQQGSTAEQESPGSRGAARKSGCMFATATVNYNDEAKVRAIVDRHPLAAMMMGAGVVGAVGVMAADDPRDLASWSTFWVVMWRGESVEELGGPEAMDFMREFVSDGSQAEGRYCEPFASAVRWTPEGSACDISDLRYWSPVPWDNRGGRVTLVGDACHAMLPFRGQGLQMSIVDASNYLDAMIEIDRCGQEGVDRSRDIMAAFEAEMIPRGAEAVQQSLAEASKAMDPGSLDKMLMVTRGHGRLD